MGGQRLFKSDKVIVAVPRGVFIMRVVERAVCVDFVQLGSWLPVINYQLTSISINTKQEVGLFTCHRIFR